MIGTSDWWTPQAAAFIGAGMGAGVGILGALLGTLIGVLAPRGKCKGLVVGTMAVAVACGCLLLLAGIAAVVARQPYHVYSPLLLVGFIAAVVIGGLIPVTLGRYRAAEQRRMHAEEFRRS